MRCPGGLIAAAIVVLSFIIPVAPCARGDDTFTPPKDGVFSEKQFDKYLAVTRDWLATSQAAGKAMEGAKSGAGQLAVLAGMDQKLKDALAKQGLSQDEYNWIGGQVWQAYTVVTMEDVFGKQAAETLAEQKKKTADGLDQAKARLAALTDAQKTGKRVLSKEEREAKVNESKETAKGAQDEVKQHADEAKEAVAEAAEKDKAAAAADKLAKNPPPDISADDRASYIDERKAEAQAARDAAKDARDRETDARKAMAEAQTHVDAANKLAANPDVPQSDEERAAVRQETEQAIESTKQEIQTSTQAIALLNDSEAQNKKQLEEIRSKSPPPNVDILKKHREDFEKLYNMKK